MVGLSPQSPFIRAFYDYLQNLPEKKNQRSILSRVDINDPPTAEKIQEAMRQMESKHGQKTSVKMMKRVVGPVVAVMKDYYGVLDTLCQADPTPGMVLWGALKIVIDGLGRFVDLFDRLKAEVLSMTTQLRRLTLYEEFYGQSSDMQEYLFRSYKDVFRFWCRVDKECNRCSLNSLLRASTSFSVKKLQGIVNDIQVNADQIDKLVPIIEGQYAGHERVEASLERSENKKERDEGSAWRKQMQSDRIRSWLGGQMINESNLRRHQNNIAISKAGSTCDWLLTDTKFQEWDKGTATKPMLWLFAGPGSGKSVLCSHVVDHIQSQRAKSVVAVHFYEFDDQRTALSTARILATQLFEQYWLLRQDIPDDMRDASQKSDANLINVFDFIRLLVTKLPIVYLFIDGIDEECHDTRWKEAVKIVDFVTLLATTYPENVRVWLSAQDRVVIREKLKDFSTLDVKSHIKTAVDEYILSTVPGINNAEVDQDTRGWILTELKERADGNFLWASLMLKTIESEVGSFEEMEQFIRKGLPQDLEGYYRRIFARYETRERELVSKIFSLVTFARRRLRLKELREAIGMISSEGSKSLRTRNIPWRQAVEKLLSPLIETQQDPEDPDDCFCHLFHSTVKAFLQNNPTILQMDQANGPVHIISEATIGNACLMYLSQEKYSRFLKKDTSRWFTASGESLTDHHLLTYSAKYWDKHLNEVEETLPLRERAENFVSSTNFQTTLQVQNLFVEGQYWIFTREGCSENHKFTKIVFPKWFADYSRGEGCPTFSKSYRSFRGEWNSFLHIATCETASCSAKDYGGELDRCLWKALGPQSFLSNVQGRYKDFMLSGKEGPRFDEKSPYYEGIAADGTEVVVLQLFTKVDADYYWIRHSSLGEGESQYHRESWSLTNNSMLSLLTANTISTSLNTTKWRVSGVFSDRDQQLGSPKVVSFTTDLAYVRIGCQIFSKDSTGQYHEVGSLPVILDNPRSYFEDIASRGPYFVLTSRRIMPVSSEPRGRTKDQEIPKTELNAKPHSTLGQNLKASSCEHCSREPSRSTNGSATSPANGGSDDEEESSDESLGASSSADSEWNSAEESWTEGSTEPDQDNDVPWNHILDSSEDDHDGTDSQSESEDESDASEDETASNAPVHSHGRLQEESDSDGGDIEFGCGSDDEFYDGDSDFSDDNSFRGHLDFDSDDEHMPMIRATGRKSRPDASVQRGLLTVYDLSLGTPVQIFKFSHPLPIALYESAPVIHPTKPLVVWPLCGGEVVFADFEGKTYFIRKARPSTRKTRHISMKCNFSQCGKYLHIVSLEAQLQPSTKAQRKNNIKQPLLLSAFISTHRLSTRKTARSPPTLIHRAKVSLESTRSLCPSRMPVEVTWTPESVYLSSSSESNELTVFRVDLFAPPKSNNKDTEYNPVSVPRQIILLPESARSRSVHYFPPKKEEDTRALILIGSWACKPKNEECSKDDVTHEWDNVQGLPEAISPPIGFYVHEDIDLGGWGPSNAVAEINLETDKGQLKQKMERFVGEDDCGDLETYFFA